MFITDDETEVIALVVSPICLLLLCNKYCLKKKRSGAKGDANSPTKDTANDSDEDDWQGEHTCFCQRTCRRLDIKSEEMVTKERLLDELISDLVKNEGSS